MNSEYQRLLKKLRDFLHFVGEPGELVLPEGTLEDMLLALRLRVHWFPASRTFPQGAYVCSEEAGHELLRLAWKEENGAAWRLSKKVIAHRVALRENVPEGLLTLVALHFAEIIEPPKPPRKSKSYTKRFLTLFLCLIGRIEFAEEISDKRLFMTKTSTSRPGKERNETVCDAVATVLNEWQITASYRSVQQIWNDPAERDAELRADMETYFRELISANRSDPISFIAKSASWLNADELSKPGFPLGVTEK